MQRDPAAALSRRAFSERSSARFFHLVDAVARAHEPTQTQLDSLASSYQSTADFLVASPEFGQLLVDVHGHGSRQLGTMVRPVDQSREGFDIDLIARLRRSALQAYGEPNGPVRLLNDLFSVLQRYADRHDLGIHKWERCVTLQYSGGMSADITVVIDDPLRSIPFGETHGRIPDRELRIYDPTNPQGYNRFFNAAAAVSPRFTTTLTADTMTKSMTRADVAPLPNVQEVFERLLCRLIQMLKLHRNTAFGFVESNPDAAPTSVFLTTLAAKAYTACAPIPHASPLELLLDIVESLPAYFERYVQANGTEVWYLANPSSPRDNLAAGMNTPARQAGFRWWHGRMVKQLSEILEAIEQQSGLDKLVAAVSTAFGERSAHALQSQQATQRSIARQVGRVVLMPAAGAAMPVSARQHTFFGVP